MSYHVFSNLGTKLNADTASKLMAGIDDLKWITRPCNCGPIFKVDGQCLHGGKCRVACVVYKATCKCCNQVYIGKSQRYWKKECKNTSGMCGKCWKDLKDPQVMTLKTILALLALTLFLDILLVIVLTL